MLGAEHSGKSITHIRFQLRRSHMKANLTPTEAPPEEIDTGSASDPNDSVEQFIRSAVADGFAELRKELTPARRFTNPVAADDTFKVPTTVKRYSSLKHFTGPGSDERAYRFGMFCLGVYGKKQGIEFCHKQG